MAGWLSLKADENFFTDRCTDGARALAPSELDLALELSLHHRDVSVGVAFERDLPLVQSASAGCGAAPSALRSQTYVSLMASWSFDATLRR